MNGGLYKQVEKTANDVTIHNIWNSNLFTKYSHYQDQPSFHLCSQQCCKADKEKDQKMGLNEFAVLFIFIFLSSYGASMHTQVF